MLAGDNAARADPRRRIAIDGYNLALKQGTGVATYGRGLAAAVRRLGLGLEAVFGINVPDGADALRREVAFFDPPADSRRRNAVNLVRGAAEVGAAWLGRPEAREIVFTGAVVPEAARERLPAFDRVWNHRRLFTVANHHFRHTGRRLRVHVAQPPAVMHWTFPVPVELAGARNIYTVHDLVPLRLPQTTLDDKARFIRLMRLLSREADHLVTVSEASRRDILQLLGVDGARVTNTWQSVEPFAPATRERTEALVRGALGLEPRGYLLFFGAIEPKKNVGRLLEAYYASGVATPLVLVGKEAWGVDDELAHLRAAQAGGGPARVIHLQHAPRVLLEALVRGARAVVFPSLYEGFGLPVAEAMAAGAAVLTSDRASLPEVAGDAALQVDPYDAAALAEALRRLDGDEALRSELSARARGQAERFSPAAYAQRLAPVYCSLGVEV